MENLVSVFSNKQFGNIRIAMSENNEPLFCLPDICRALDLTNPAMVKTRLAQKGISSIDTLTTGGNQKITYINEANLYKCIFQSRKAEAEQFQDWVTDDVLPSIRKHGAYMTNETIEKALSSPDFLIELATKLKNQQKLNDKLTAQIRTYKSESSRLVRLHQEQYPKVLFSNAVETSKRSCLIAELAKILQQNGIAIGQNRLFKWMREHGYLCTNGEKHNQPSQKAMERGLFEIKQTTINKPDGTILVSCTPKITGKGQIYFVNKFLNPAEKKDN